MGEWIEYKSKHKGFYDPRTGRKLSSIKGRRNRPNIDPFEAYPTEYLDVEKDKILEMYERKHKVLIHLNILDAETDLVIEATPKDFKAKRITRQEAQEMIETVFDVKLIKSESGVKN